MAKTYSATKHLYTLNDSVALPSLREKAKKNYPVANLWKTNIQELILKIFKGKIRSIFLF